MAEARMLKKKVSLNEALADLDNDTHRLLFTWAIPHLDIEGRITGNPRVFKAMVAPLLDHLTSEKITKFFKNASDKGLITYYKIDKNWWIEYPKFKENQNLRDSREAPSKIPAPPENSWITPGELLEQTSTPPAEEKRREEKIINTIVPPERGNGIEEKFEIWWKAYPPRRKSGKPAVKAKWLYLHKTGKLLPFDKMLEVLEAQKQSQDWIKEAGEYIPAPHPYLVQFKFLDESVTVQTVSSKNRHNPSCPRCHGSGTYLSGETPDNSPIYSPCNCNEVGHGKSQSAN